MDDAAADLQTGVIDYYTGRVRKHGSTPLGVDWTCVLSQELRFVQLLKVCDFARPFALNDVGCGYGALVGYLGRRHAEAEIDYLGVDLAAEMIRRARRLWRRRPRTAFATGDARHRPADYSVASGIFNVKLDQPRARWERYVARTLDDLRAASREGFAVNFMRACPAAAGGGDVDDGPLYRTAPDRWIDHCERAHGASVTLLDDYGQPEFTLLVRPGGACRR